MTDDHESRTLRYNIAVNLTDGGFFGFAIGFASFLTIIPLFVSTYTDSAVLIGLIPAIHSFGWQIPQLFTARRVGNLSQYRPTVLLLTIHERLPFLGLALIAYFANILDHRLLLGLVFTMLVWQALGGGVTATAWQSMIGKIIPAARRGTFFGVQAAAASLFASLSAVLAGYLLERLPVPLNFSACFLLAFLNLALSWYFLSLTKEQSIPVEDQNTQSAAFTARLFSIIRRDAPFRAFLVIRVISQFAIMGFGFYTVYLTRKFHASPVQLGLMTSTFLGAQIVANPFLGWLGDRAGHPRAMLVGLVSAALSAALALFAPSLGWFYLVFILAGIAVVAAWTIALAMTLDFGELVERPAYIGLANTLVAPATFIAPLAGGWLADASGYPLTFTVSLVASLVTAVFLLTYRKAAQTDATLRSAA